MARQRKRTKGATIKSLQPEVPKPIFSDETSEIIPGEVIVQLRPEASAQITESIPTGPSHGLITPGPRRFGVSSLDRVLGELQVTSVTRLTPPAPTMTDTAEEVMALASTFKIRYESKTSAEAAAEMLSNVNGVEYAEPNRYRETTAIPNDALFPSQWGLSRINCPAAWDRTTGSPGVVVAVIDTGVDLDHPELAALLVPGWDMVDLGPTPTPPLGFHFEGDFMGRDSVPQDDVGHGTHVAGTIACASNNSNGVAGVTWNCRIMPVRVLARIVNNTNPGDVRGTGSAADIAAGIRHAVDHGARVLNLSLRGFADTMVERDAVAYAISRGAVVVAAMGNDAINTPVFPAAYPGVVAVGAINNTDRRPAFSNTGPHIDVAAPGVDIWSTVWDNGFTRMTGTSMASPHVAGVAALIMSCNSSLTGAQVADIIRQTAQPLRDNPGDPVPNDNYGFGCVDARAALARACPIIVRPSRVLITCPKSILMPCITQPIACKPSVLIRCPSQPIVCQKSFALVCRSQPIICEKSAVILCPTMPIICEKSLLVRCESGIFCEIDRPDIPREGDPFGSGGEDWSAYDPYANSYGEADETNDMQ